MRRLSEEAVPRYVRIVDQIFKEFFEEVNTDRGVVDIEVSVCDREGGRKAITRLLCLL